MVNKRKLVFGASHPGRFCRWILSQLGGTLIRQKDAFCARGAGVSQVIAFQASHRVLR
jgi:hypothetical protein